MMNGYGMDGGSWLLMLGVWVGLLGLLVFVVARLAGGGDRAEARAVRREPSPFDVADQRLARGEIDAETHAALIERLSDRTGW